jgi:hypothetical protein
MKNKILVVSDTVSDLSDVLFKSCRSEIISFRRLGDTELDEYCCVALLAGNSDSPVILDAAARTNIERYRAAGGRVFSEFICSIGQMYSGTPERLTHHRSVFAGNAGIDGLETGDLFDTHYNENITYYYQPENINPILVCHPYLSAHSKVSLPGNELLCGVPSLWLYDQNMMVCAFRLSNFNRARLAPQAKWRALIEYILGWLQGSAVKAVFPEPVCYHNASQSLEDCIKRGLGWYENAGMLVENGKRGVKEGFNHQIDAKNGRQLVASQIRTDCCGETGGAFMFDYLLNGNPQSLQTAENIEDFCFDYLQEKDGLYKGMVRWTECAWQTCYQDDVARAILPTLLKATFMNKEGTQRHLDDAFSALDFLVKTTGTNGLRSNRTDCANLSQAEMERIRTTESGRPSAHYNAYYHATLLLAYKICKKQIYFDTARNGLETIMALYPDTKREQSETQEMCRLIFPLACLYELSGEEKHKKMLYRVTTDLQPLRHACGGYAEWDTGYRANCSRREAGECSLLAENGDPVADLLYSVNWLPLGFSYAYYVTKDNLFHDLWSDVARFFCLAQIQSKDKALDGAWARAFDMELNEIYGVPHDVGWAPCSIESGWTVGEILMGLMLMKYIDG